MKKLLIIFFAFVLLAGAGVYFILPTNMNWNEYVKQVETEVKNRTGLQLAISGQPVFSMKSATLRMGNVTLKNFSDAHYPNLMTAKNVEISFDSKALFKRDIKIKKITLGSPEFYFERLPDGNWNWQTAFFKKAAQNRTLGFESLFFSKGTAFVRSDKYTPVKEWKNVNAEMFANSLQGPFFFEGNFGAKNTVFGFSLRIQEFLPNQSPDFTLQLINAPAEASFVFSGKYGLLPSDADTLIGSLTFDIRKPDSFFDILYPNSNLSKELFQPVVGNLKLNKNPKDRTSEITEILFKYGNSAAKGRLNIEKLSAKQVLSKQSKEEEIFQDLLDEIVLRDPKNPSVAVKLDNSTNVAADVSETLLPKKVKGNFVFSKLESDVFLDNSKEIADFFIKTKYFAETQDTYDIDFSFDTIVYKKDNIHSLKTKVVSLKDEGLKFENISATLPSNAMLDGNAILSLKNKPVLSGDLSLETDNLDVVLSWLGYNAPEQMPQNLLHFFKGKSDFMLAENAFGFQKVNAELDKIAFSGDFLVRLGKRKAVSIKADFSDLDFSSYFPETVKDFAKKREDFAKISPLEKVQKLFLSLDKLNDIDVNLEVKSDKVSFGDIYSDNLEVDLALVRGQMEIDNISIERFFASTLKLSGGVDGFGGQPHFNSFNIVIDSKQLSSLLTELNIKLPKELSVKDTLKFSTTLSGDLPVMDIKLMALFDVSNIEINGDVRGLDSPYKEWDVDFNVQHENFRTFMALFFDKYRPILANPGKTSFKGHFIKNKDILSFTDITGFIGQSDFTGLMKITKKDTPLVQMKVSSKNLYPLGMMPKMNFVDVVSIDTDNVKQLPFWEKDAFVSNILKNNKMSDKIFDFSFLGNVRVDAELKADNMVFNSFSLSKVDTLLQIEKDKLSIDLRNSLWGKANLGGISTIKVGEKSTDLSIATRLSKIDIKNKLFETDSLNLEKLAQAALTLNLKTTGNSTKEWLGNLSGKGSFEFKSGVLSGFDFEKIETDAKLVSDVFSKDEILKNTLAGDTELTEFKADFMIDKEILSVHPISFMLAGYQNDDSFLKFAWKSMALSSKLNFKSMALMDEIYSYSLLKKPSDNIVVNNNILNILEKIIDKKQSLIDEKNLAEQKKQDELQKKIELENAKLKELAVEQSQKQQLEIMQRKERQKKALLELSELETKITLALLGLDEKISRIQSFSGKVPFVNKYLNQLASSRETLQFTLSKLAFTKKKSPENIDSLKQITLQKLSEITEDVESSYTSAILIGIKGVILDYTTQAEEISAYETKMKTLHSDLKNIALDADSVSKKTKEIEKLREASEQNGVTDEELLVLQGQIEVLIADIKVLQQNTEKLVAEKNKKIEAEKQKEIEKQKAIETAELAKEQRKKELLDVKKQKDSIGQNSIIRKDGISNKESFSLKKDSTGDLKTLDFNNDETVKVKSKSPMIIRKK